jgi:hypothetical protein
MTTVQKGQLWQVALSYGKMRIRVENVGKDKVVARTVSGRKLTMARAVLERGRRAARLIELAPGIPVEDGRRSVLCERVSQVLMTKAEQTSASAYRRTKPPRGVTNLRGCDEEALRLFEDQHLTVSVIAERQGVSKSTAQGRLKRARNAREDRALLKAMGDS